MVGMVVTSYAQEGVLYSSGALPLCRPVGDVVQMHAPPSDGLYFDFG